MKNELIEVENRLKKLSLVNNPGKWKPESYIGGGESKFKFLNLKVPHIRSDSKKGYSFSKRSFEEQWKVWDYIWHHTEYFEVALSASHFMNLSSIEDLNNIHKELLGWQRRVDNWALSDELSHCYSRMLEYNKPSLLPSFENWNRSSNPWEVRQSMVGLLFYSRFRKKILPCSKILSFVKPHLSHSHYYVQKAVGWTIRECWNVYPEETYEFMKKHARLIPSGGWSSATEKLSLTLKMELKTIRKS